MKMQITIYLTLLSIFLILLINCFSVKAHEWSDNFEEARNIARRKGKNILMIFHRSDQYFINSKMEKHILNSETFKMYSEKYLTLFKIDISKQEHNGLTMVEELQNKKLEIIITLKAIIQKPLSKLRQLVS